MLNLIFPRPSKCVLNPVLSTVVMTSFDSATFRYWFRAVNGNTFYCDRDSKFLAFLPYFLYKLYLISFNCNIDAFLTLCYTSSGKRLSLQDSLTVGFITCEVWELDSMGCLIWAFWRAWRRLSRVYSSMLEFAGFNNDSDVRFRVVSWFVWPANKLD